MRVPRIAALCGIFCTAVCLMGLTTGGFPANPTFQSVQVGAPTGGNKGAGSLNAQSLFVNNVAVATGAIPAGANPSASIGLSANNGVATTFMRSDATPALLQNIAPTWTGIHQFSGGSAASAANPAQRISNNQLIEFLDSTSSATNGGFLYVDTSNILNIGAANGADLCKLTSTLNCNVPFNGPNVSGPVIETGNWTFIAYDGANGMQLGNPSTSGQVTHVDYYTNGTLKGSVTNGMVLNAPTGGDQGVGTINVSGGYYINGVIQTPPTNTSGTYTATLSTGCTTTPTATAKWVKVGGIVTINFGNFGTCTSNSAGTALDASVPVAERPASNQIVNNGMIAEDNGVRVPACVRVLTTGVIDFDTGGTTGGACAGASWTSSGVKALNSGFTITYQVVN